MTFLPIVDRELHVAARSKGTYYVRLIVAAIAVVVGGFTLLVELLNSAMGGSGASSIGATLFSVLSWYLFAICLLAGIFLASDSLSSERREGTLGLLFLTDLKGYDIVLGKLFVVSLNAFYGLLAVFPVMAISLILGGVTGAELARMCLALLNALWFSVAVAMWVSSRSVLTHRATIQTLLLLILLSVVLPIPAATVANHFWVSVICAISPYVAFQYAQAAYYYYGHGESFWLSLAASHLTGWVLVGLASWHLPRFMEARTENRSVWRSLSAGDVSFGKKSRQRALLEVNPVTWLMEDSRGLKWTIGGISVAGAVAQCFCIGTLGGVVASSVAWPFFFLLKLLFALQACRFFSEARRTGTLELVCATPINDKTIYAGLWLSLRRLFLWPVVGMMAVELVCSLLSLILLYRTSPGLMAGFPILINVPSQLATVAADFFAVAWFGLWISLTGKKPQSSAGLTILFVIVLPMIVFCLPRLIVDVIFIAICSSKIPANLRMKVSEINASVR